MTLHQWIGIGILALVIGWVLLEMGWGGGDPQKSESTDNRWKM